ncbi:hypothetical protein GCM10009733_043100 [Nonomuraea maheshkhaliensis]|uniref:Uncharacterized protein n=1 Tax=Nonomuraea maheshkhaliensis TaxID=419590 RepID=A0ABP4R8T3_9ACTN
MQVAAADTSIRQGMSGQERGGDLQQFAGGGISGHVLTYIQVEASRSRHPGRGLPGGFDVAAEAGTGSLGCHGRGRHAGRKQDVMLAWIPHTSLAWRRLASGEAS